MNSYDNVKSKAEQVVTLASIKENHGAKWDVVAMAYGGQEVREKKRGLWTVVGFRFQDGSAVSFDNKGHPLVFDGTFASEM
jgi:hypothetical protein